MNSQKTREELEEDIDELQEGDYRNGERRSRLEIIADILSVARNGATKTEIEYIANLNFARVKRYLTYLEANGFLENSGHFYQSTKRGVEFLRDYQMMRELLRT